MDVEWEIGRLTPLTAPARMDEQKNRLKRHWSSWRG